MAKPKTDAAPAAPQDDPVVLPTETLDELQARLDDVPSEPEGDDGLEHPLEGLADHPDEVVEAAEPEPETPAPVERGDQAALSPAERAKALAMVTPKKEQADG